MKLLGAVFLVHGIMGMCFVCPKSAGNHSFSVKFGKHDTHIVCHEH